MKKIIFFLGVCLVTATGCEKSNNESETEFPEGKWVSIAFLSDEGNWTTDPMPHYWDFDANKSSGAFRFKDHNGIECSGEYNLVTPINTFTQFDFPNQTCGLTSRVIESYKPDTMVLRVITPPNITKETVKYLRLE